MHQTCPLVPARRRAWPGVDVDHAIKARPSVPRVKGVLSLGDAGRRAHDPAGRPRSPVLSGRPGATSGSGVKMVTACTGFPAASHGGRRTAGSTGRAGRRRSADGSTVVDVAVPGEDLAPVREAHDRLHRTVGGVGLDAVRRPSGLPGWSVGHVLTDLARNADSIVRRLAHAERGERVEQYAGGQAGRAAEIERGARRPPSEIIDDLVAADRQLDAAFAATPSTVWDELVAAGSGDVVIASHLAFARWREVEIHHVDLGLGYRPGDWPEAFVERMLERTLPGLPSRADPRILLAWALGRAAPPDLDSWGEPSAPSDADWRRAGHQTPRRG